MSTFLAEFEQARKEVENKTPEKSSNDNDRIIIPSLIMGLTNDRIRPMPALSPPDDDESGVCLRIPCKPIELAILRTHSLTKAVGVDSPNRPEDVRWVKWRLHLHVNPETGRPYLENLDLSDVTLDPETEHMLALFQEHNTRYRDCRVDRRGPTQRALARSPVKGLSGSVGRGGDNHAIDVIRVQQALVAHGYLLAGHFALGEIDPDNPEDATQAAINLFQRNHTHQSDGRIDVRRETHRQLRKDTARLQLRNLKLTAAVGEVQEGQHQTKEDILSVQLQLVHHGALAWNSFNHGEMNDATLAAIRSFQSRFTKEPDGRVDPRHKTSQLLARSRSEMDLLYPRPETDELRAFDSRRGVDDMADDVDQAPRKAPVPPPPAMDRRVPRWGGFELEAFPVGGSQFNIGYDKNATSWDNPEHNTDYYRAGKSGHPGGHHGIDIFGPRGAPIVAPVSGRIVRVVSRDSGAAGRRVVIARGDATFYLAHLESVDENLRKGQWIDAGTVVGTLGNSGNARGTAPHLHFSCYKRNNYYNSVDPFPFLKKLLDE
ncbi:peptidoglycan DD-metalloendopeptidase family protein [Myxococcota bacterium]